MPRLIWKICLRLEESDHLGLALFVTESDLKCAFLRMDGLAIALPKSVSPYVASPQMTVPSNIYVKLSGTEIF